MWESLTKIVHIQIFNQLAQVGVEDVGEECVEHLKAGFPREMFEVTRNNADTNIKKHSAIRIVILLITLSLSTVIAKLLKQKEIMAHLPSYY